MNKFEISSAAIGSAIGAIGVGLYFKFPLILIAFNFAVGFVFSLILFTVLFKQ